MFERFTSGARRVVVLAQAEARGLDHGYIGTEHLLLALVLDDGPAGIALRSLGLEIDATRRRSRRSSAPKRRAPSPGTCPSRRG